VHQLVSAVLETMVRLM